MTEQEIMQQIDASERQIYLSYNSLRSAAREVGTKGVQAAQSARDSAVSQASSSKAAKTLLPLLISLVGLFLFGSAWFLALLMVIGGIVLAYNLYQKADSEKRSVESQYNSMVSVAENQQRNLNSILDNNARI